MFYDFSKGCYYFLVILCLIYEIQILYKPRSLMRVLEWQAAEDERPEKEREEDREAKWSAYSEQRKNAVYMAFIQTFYTVVTLLGLFSYNWYVFLALLLIGLSMTAGKKYGLLRASAVAVSLDALVCCVLLTYAVLNTYHFQVSALDVWHLFRG